MLLNSVTAASFVLNDSSFNFLPAALFCLYFPLSIRRVFVFFCCDGFLFSKQIQAERKLIWALVSCVVELRESKAKCPPNFWRDLNWYLSKIV